jgi:uncharacterized protein involved in oxidation of intracellular sulfur
MADAVTVAKAGQNTRRLLQCRVNAEARSGRQWPTCMDAVGLDDAAPMSGARRSTVNEPAAATIEADKVLIF